MSLLLTEQGSLDNSPIRCQDSLGPLYFRIAFQGTTIVLAGMEENPEVLSHDEWPKWATVPATVPAACGRPSLCPPAQPARLTCLETRECPSARIIEVVA